MLHRPCGTVRGRYPVAASTAMKRGKEGARRRGFIHKCHAKAEKNPFELQVCAAQTASPRSAIFDASRRLARGEKAPLASHRKLGHVPARLIHGDLSQNTSHN